MSFELNIKTAEDLAAEADAKEKAQFGARVNAERERRLSAGVTVSVTGYGPIPVQGRPADQTNMIALSDTAKDLAAAGITAPVIPFRDRDNAVHNLTPQQVVELTRKAKETAAAIYAASWALKDADTIAADFADDAYWP